MKSQILFSRKNKKSISKCLVKFLPSMQSVNTSAIFFFFFFFHYFSKKIRLDTLCELSA